MWMSKKFIWEWLFQPEYDNRELVGNLTYPTDVEKIFTSASDYDDTEFLTIKEPWLVYKWDVDSVMFNVHCTSNYNAFLCQH